MAHFDLPHHHGDLRLSEKLYQALETPERFLTAAEFFHLLSDPNRVRIFWVVMHQETCVINIAAMLQMSSPAVSYHLRALTESGLTESRRDGKEVYYRGADTEAARLLHDILEQIMEVACPETENTAQASPEEIAHRVHAHLVEHLSERFTIETLSRQFHINPTTLKQAFKKRYGTSIAAHINEHRMEKAAKALRETDESIAAISRSVGYESQSRFTTMFRSRFGVLPTEYRKQSQ